MKTARLFFINLFLPCYPFIQGFHSLIPLGFSSNDLDITWEIGHALLALLLGKGTLLHQENHLRMSDGLDALHVVLP